MTLRQLFPKSFRLHFQLLKRHFADRRSGVSKKFAKAERRAGDFQFSIAIRQPIFPNPFLENKIHNLRLAIGRVEKVVVLPGEVFSFWKIVGAPGKKQGFREGRNLIAGKLQQDFGGGLCQLSGILYHAALVGGLKIEERHNHSTDFYADHERLTPLGADATVAFGYKDLRLENGFPFPVRFGFDLKNDGLVCRLESPVFLPAAALFFEIQEQENRKIVATRRVFEAGKLSVLVAESVYL